MPEEFHGAFRNAIGDKYHEVGKPAEIVYNSVGMSLQQYCGTRETQYLDKMSDTWEMIEKGSNAVKKYIDENW